MRSTASRYLLMEDIHRSRTRKVCRLLYLSVKSLITRSS